MNNRILNILNQIKNSILKKNESVCTSASYKYKCLKCGLILEFNRNQSSTRCPNDNSTMLRV